MRIGDLKKTIGLLDDVLSTSKPWTARKITGIFNKNPQRYEQMTESGMFDLMKKGELSEDVFRNIDDNLYFTENFLSDINRVYRGKPLVRELPEGTRLENLRHLIDEGEAGFLNGKLYAIQDGKAVEIQLSKEKFEELFPLMERFKTAQGEVGDCWLVSSIENFMSNPTQRVELYKLFRQDGDDILIKYPNGKNELRFINGEPFDDGGRLCSGAKGIRMLEQSFIFHRAKAYTKHAAETDVIARLEENPKLIWKLHNGLQAEFSDAVYGHDRLDWAGWKEFFKDEFVNTLRYQLTTTRRQRRTSEELRRWVEKDKPYLVAYSCDMPGDMKFREGIVNPDYDLFAPHAYSLQDYNAEQQLAILNNPHHTEVLIEAPLEVLEEYGSFMHFGNKLKCK